MRVIFPQKWDAQFPSEQITALCLDEWAIGIMDLADEQLAVGVAKVRKECTWPPTIAEFREACLGDDKHWMYKTIEANKHLKRLPVKKASDEVYQAEREKLRRLGIRI